MTVQHPWMMIVGCALIGWLFVEFVGQLVRPGVSIPVVMNIISAIAFALIAAAVCA